MLPKLQTVFVVLIVMVVFLSSGAEAVEWRGYGHYGPEVCSAYRSMWGDIPESEARFDNPEFVKDIKTYQPQTFKIERGGVFADFREPPFNEIPETRAEFEKLLADIRKFTTTAKQHGMKIQTYSAIYDLPLSGKEGSTVNHLNPSSWALVSDILGPIPKDDPISWMQVNAEGKPMIIPYWRRPDKVIEYYGCVNNPSFYRYIEGFWMGEIAAGVNGGYNDNPGFCEGACYCNFCKSAFRKFISDRFNSDELNKYFNISDKQQVQPPTEIISLLWPQWLIFRINTMADFHKRLAKKAHQLNPESEITCNMSHDSEEKGRACDYIYLEVSASPRRVGNDRIQTVDYYRFLSACAGNKRVHPLYLPHKFNEGPKESQYARCLLQLAEAAACGVSYENYLSQCRQNPSYGRAVADWFAFVRKYADIYKGQSNFADVAIVCSASGRFVEKDIASDRHPSSRGLLTDGSIPVSGILREQLTDKDLASKYRCIVMPPVPMLSDAEAAGVINYIRSGGALVLIGISGNYDERALRRDEDPLAKLYQTLGVNINSPDDMPLAAMPIKNGNGYLCYFSNRRQGSDIPGLAEVVQRLRRAPSLVRVYGGQFVEATLMHRTGSLLLNVLNYDVTVEAELVPAKNIGIDLQIPPGKKVKKVTIFTPGKEPEPFKFETIKKVYNPKIQTRPTETDTYVGIIADKSPKLIEPEPTEKNISLRLMATLPELYVYTAVLVDLE